MDVRSFGWVACMWIQAQIWYALGLGDQPGSILRVSEKDILLLEADENPKCFTRTLNDFTCFWEVSHNESYDFFYRQDEYEKTCRLTRQKGDRNTFLHVCSFPALDVFLFTDTDIRVVESQSNSSVLSRRVNIENQVLLDPPTNVSLSTTGEPAQLQLAWLIPVEWRSKIQYEIRYWYSNSQAESTKTKISSQDYRLHSLIPGEMCHVQLRIKPSGYSTTGFWSDWSQSVAAMVPQSAEDIDLLCHTSDLRNIRCLWKKETSGKDVQYNVFYRLSPSDGWHQCVLNKGLAHCVFSAWNSSSIAVHLSTGEDPCSRNFYAKPFTLNGSIKTDPPKMLSWGTEGGRFHVQWEPPLRNLSAHFVYQIRYSLQGESAWKLVTLQRPETSTSLDVQAGSCYLIQVKTKPNGSIYSGFWSDWSNSLSVDMPPDRGILFVAAILLTLFIVAALLITSLARNISKIKQLLWPPVPNLEKVLQHFLTDITKECQSHTFSVKQCYDETPASVVEIVCEREPFGGGKPPKDGVLQPEGKTVEAWAIPPEMFPDYVTLNMEAVVPNLKSNEYVAEVGRLLGVGLEVWQPGVLAPSTDLLNHSYLLPTDRSKGLGFRSARESAGRYTNL